MHKGDFALIAITIGILAAAVYVRLYVHIPMLYDILTS
jgi:hypothetical protein